MQILLLAANPGNTSRLRLDKEAREIEESLQRSHQQIRFESRWAVRTRDLQRALLELKPEIVHFSGHGDDDKGLILEDDQGQAHYLPNNAVETLFKLFSNHIQCVVLNACYSETQARVISLHIPYVIGMNSAINDLAAIEFSRSFYDALAAGENIPFAYDLACNAIHLLAMHDEHLTPVFLQSDTAKIEKPVLPKANLLVAQGVESATQLRREGLQHRQRLLIEKLTRLELAYDLEGRVEERMRMEVLVVETREALHKVEEELGFF